MPFPKDRIVEPMFPVSNCGSMSSVITGAVTIVVEFSVGATNVKSACSSESAISISNLNLK